MRSPVLVLLVLLLATTASESPCGVEDYGLPPSPTCDLGFRDAPEPDEASPWPTPTTTPYRLDEARPVPQGTEPMTSRSTTPEPAHGAAPTERRSLQEQQRGEPAGEAVPPAPTTPVGPDETRPGGAQPEAHRVDDGPGPNGTTAATLGALAVVLILARGVGRRAVRSWHDRA